MSGAESAGESRALKHPIRESLLAGLLLLALCAVSFFWRLGANGLWDLDEALYTESAREMRLSGDYVTPRVNGEPFFEKPPLLYWEAAGSFALFGRNELAARLPSALASTVVVALLFLVGSRVFSFRAGILASSFYAVSPLVFGAARQLTTDATLTLCITAALLAFFAATRAEKDEPPASLEAQRHRGEASENPVDLFTHDASRITSPASRITPLLIWLFCGLGVMAKGLPGILIPVVVGAVTLGFWERWDWRAMWRAAMRLRPVAGVLVFVAVALPWHVLAWIRSGPAFVHEYIIVQHLVRFRGGDTAHKAPFWFFIPGFLIGFFPLSIFVPAALLERSRDSSGDVLDFDRAAAFRTLLKVWAVTVFVMFSASGSKLISYILPMYPPAALLAGDWCARAMAHERGMRILRRGGWLLFILAAALFVILMFRDQVIAFAESMSHRPVRLDEIPAGTFEWAAHLFGVVAVATGGFAVLATLRRARAAFGVLAAGLVLFLGVATGEGLPLLNGSLVAPLQTITATAGRLAEEERAPLALYFGPPRRPSALFYLPDSLISSQGRVFEVMGAEDSHNNIDAFLAPNPHAVIVTDTSRVSYLLESQRMRVVDRRGKWHVLER
jgi:4-amino-4-deoxy-L-arabinose transferase-like glycosyltransferase